MTALASHHIRALRRDAKVMLECAAFMADLARLQLERVAEAAADLDVPDIEAADAIDSAINAIASAKRSLTE